MTELINPEKEPEMYEKIGLKHGLKIETSEHISWKIKNQHYINFNSVPKEKREEILSLFKKGGIKIKDVAEKFNLDSMVVADIIYLNISHVPILNEVSL